MERKDISQDYNSIFDQNNSDFLEEDNMNRDYLQMIYNDDMDSLNKEIRMTRTQYYQKHQKIVDDFEKEIKIYKKNLKIFTIIMLVFVGFGLFSLYMSLDFHDLYREAYRDIVFSTLETGSDNDQEVAEYIRMGIAAFGTTATISLLVGFSEFAFFGGGTIKHIYRLNKNRQRALNRLEDMKKEHMLAGTYDASK
jgi:hypothetical protein